MMTLEMLTAREQLMEDIDAIITSQYLSDKIDEDDINKIIDSNLNSLKKII